MPAAHTHVSTQLCLYADTIPSRYDFHTCANKHPTCTQTNPQTPHRPITQQGALHQNEHALIVHCSSSVAPAHFPTLTPLLKKTLFLPTALSVGVTNTFSSSKFLHRPPPSPSSSHSPRPTVFSLLVSLPILLNGRRWRVQPKERKGSRRRRVRVEGVGGLSRGIHSIC